MNTRRNDQALYDAQTSTLIFWGWITAVLVAPIGFVIGIVVLTRNRIGQGIAIMLVAIIVTASLAAVVGGSDEPEPTYQIELEP